MKNKKLMSSKDKRKYLWYKIKTNIGTYIMFTFFASFGVFAVIAFVVAPLLNTTDLKEINIIYYVICFLLFAFLYFIFSAPFKVLFFKDVYIIDGHIFKKHFHHYNDNKMKGTFMARAISEDGGITTKWIEYPASYFKKGNAKVKIAVRKNKAIDFYLNEE